MIIKIVLYFSSSFTNLYNWGLLVIYYFFCILRWKWQGLFESSTRLYRYTHVDDSVFKIKLIRGGDILSSFCDERLITIHEIYWNELQLSLFSDFHPVEIESINSPHSEFYHTISINSSSRVRLLQAFPNSLQTLPRFPSDPQTSPSHGQTHNPNNWKLPTSRRASQTSLGKS